MGRFVFGVQSLHFLPLTFVECLLILTLGLVIKKIKGTSGVISNDIF